MLDGIASLAVAAGDAERSARLLGATEALRAAARIVTPLPYRRDFHDQIVAAVRGQLGERAVAEAWGAGRTLSLDAATHMALAAGDP